MFNHLTLSNLRALKKCELLNLGKINIICGKNNSGKSTILEALSKRENRRIGICFDSNSIEQFYGNLLSRTGWRGDSKTLNELFKKELDSVIQLKSIWFPFDNEFFVGSIVEKVNEDSNLRRYSINQAYFNNNFLNLFEDVVEPILIPPKRNLKLNIQIATNELITPQGSGIVNYLFYAKNQEPNSLDRKLYNQIITAFKIISSNCDIEINPDSNNLLILNFSTNGKDWIRAEDCGLGLQELILILYYSIHPKYKIILIEEPENHFAGSIAKCNTWESRKMLS